MARRQRQRCPQALRLVSFHDEGQKREFQVLRNNLRLAAKTIAAIYKNRWAVELYFKALQPILKLKTFIAPPGSGEDPGVDRADHDADAALAAAEMALGLVDVASGGMLRTSLFRLRGRWAWQDSPVAVPPDLPVREQVAVAL